MLAQNNELTQKHKSEKTVQNVFLFNFTEQITVHAVCDIRIIIIIIIIIIIFIIEVYFRQKPTEHKKAMNNKTERQTEYKRTETATKRHMHTMK